MKGLMTLQSESDWSRMADLRWLHLWAWHLRGGQERLWWAHLFSRSPSLAHTSSLLSHMWLAHASWCLHLTSEMTCSVDCIVGSWGSNKVTWERVPARMGSVCTISGNTERHSTPSASDGVWAEWVDSEASAPLGLVYHWLSLVD